MNLKLTRGFPSLRRASRAMGLLAATLAVAGTAASAAYTAQAATASAHQRASYAAKRPVALVYRGSAACDGCAEAAAALLARQPEHFVVRYIGPRERLHFSPAAFRGAAVYVQPGGNDDLDGTWRELLRERGFSAALIRNYVHGGGRYLGLCMGGYLAGSTDTGDGGFRFLPGDSAEYVGSRGADVHTLIATLVHVTWLGGRKPERRTMYFQDGPYFPGPFPAGARVLARYRNRGSKGKVAMLIIRWGRGVVAVSGPHPEATPDWYSGSGLPSWYKADLDIGNTLVAALVRA